ncbi:MAG: hypothetical protein EXS64_16440 [Candidatus Latescibacteria bacterium]|nr:hypothetical protein [Candidatus Latescibacterota bacterium]
MPNVTVNWLPKGCRTPEVKRKVADAIIAAMAGVKDAEIAADRVTVEFTIIDETQPKEGYKAQK